MIKEYGRLGLIDKDSNSLQMFCVQYTPYFKSPFLIIEEGQYINNNYNFYRSVTSNIPNKEVIYSVDVNINNIRYTKRINYKYDTKKLDFYYN